MRPSVAIILIGLASIIWGCDSEETPPFGVQVDIKPHWNNSGQEAIDPDSISHEFHILWDQSVPMGGYVHRSNPDSQSTLRLINQLLINVRAETNFKGGRGSLKCHGITDTITSIDCDSEMLRDFFNGNESRLDHAIEYVTEGLLNGTFQGAALVSDLIATTDDIIGAAALLPILNNSTIKAYYNSGKIDIAILGIKVDYWGVHIGACQTSSDPLGCEFNDFEDRYQKLNNVVKRPIYILIMGWRSPKETFVNNAVDKMGSLLYEDLRSEGIEVKHETITQGQLESQENFNWYPSYKEGSGYQTVGLSNEGYYCKDSEEHSVTGGFSDSLISIIEIELRGFENLLRATMDEINTTQVNIEIDCKSLREKIQENQSEFCDSASNKLIGKVEYSEEDKWADWSSVSHKSDQTPGLKPLINGIRPSHYEVLIEPAPPLRDCKINQ